MTYPKGSRGECLEHSRIRCGECEYVEELEEANKRYKQALEFYADRELWRREYIENYGWSAELILQDQGNKARKALKGE